MQSSDLDYTGHATLEYLRLPAGSLAATLQDLLEATGQISMYNCLTYVCTSAVTDPVVCTC